DSHSGDETESGNMPVEESIEERAQDAVDKLEKTGEYKHCKNYRNGDYESCKELPFKGDANGFVHTFLQLVSWPPCKLASPLLTAKCLLSHQICQNCCKRSEHRRCLPVHQVNGPSAPPCCLQGVHSFSEAWLFPQPGPQSLL